MAINVQQYELYIGGKMVSPKSGKYFDSIDPSTGELVGKVAEGGEEDVDAAVVAAKRGFGSKEWSGMPAVERGRLLLKIANRLLAEKKRLAEIESRDAGVPYQSAEHNVEVAARYCEYYGTWADKAYGDTIPLSPEVVDYTVREPYGVCAIITPFNYPIQVVCRSSAPALATGNTVIVKPAEQAPLSTLEFARIVHEVGIPDGVFNVVTGDGKTGNALVSHPDVQHVTFTGSIFTGKKILQTAAENLVPVLLELGGKAPYVLFEDADLDTALSVLVGSIFKNAGQACSAGSRLLVQRTILERVVEELSTIANRLRVGRAIDSPDMGPVISEKQMNRILSYIEKGKEEGAELVCGGRRLIDNGLNRGFFVAPTIFNEVNPRSIIAQEEIFGPVLSIIPFSTEEEALEIANSTEFGLNASIWTQDIGRAMRFSKTVQAGQIFVNTYGVGGGVEMPVGGFKKSGFGREKGKEGLLAYTQVKNVCIKF